MKHLSVNDFALIPWINTRMENRSDPTFSAGNKGQFYIRPDGSVGINDGTQTATLRSTATPIVNGDVSPTANIALSKLAVNPLDRANHQGFQGANTIGDFTSAAQAAFTEALVRARLGVATAIININNQQIGLVADPTADQHAANKRYVDNAVQGLKAKQIAVVATTGNVNLSSPGGTFDGVSYISDDAPVRVLVKNQTDASQNGIYRWNGATSAMTRATDADTADELANAYLFVAKGSTQAETGWIADFDGGTLGTDPVNFVQFSSAGQVTAGAGLQKVGNTISIAPGGIGVDMYGDDTVRLKKLNYAIFSTAKSGIDLLDQLGLSWQDPLGNNQVRMGVAVDNVTLDRDDSTPSGGLPTDSFGGRVRSIRIKDGAIDLAGAKVSTTNALPISRGGTGVKSSADILSLLVSLGVARIWKSSAIPASAASTIVIAATTHGLGTGAQKIIQVQLVSTGEVIEVDRKGSDTNGDVTITFAQSQPANSLYVTITG